MSDSICVSFRRLPHSDYAGMGGGVNIINIFVVSADARKLRTLTRNIRLIGHGRGGSGGVGVKGLPDDNFEPQAKKNKLSVAANLI